MIFSPLIAKIIKITLEFCGDIMYNVITVRDNLLNMARERRKQWNKWE